MSIDALTGWFDFGGIYREWIADAPEGSILVEVGVAFGKSLAFLAREAIDQKRDDLVIYGVDPWLPQDWIERDKGAITAPYGGRFFCSFLGEMLKHAPEELERVNLLRLPSVDAAVAFAEASVWAVFIDGDHSERAVRADIAAWLPKVESGGWIGGHDFENGHGGPEKAVRALFGDDVQVRGTSWLRSVR